MKPAAVVYLLYIGIFLCGPTHAAPFSNHSYIEEYEGRQVTLACWKEEAVRLTDIDWMKKSEKAANKRVATKLMSGRISYYGDWGGGQVTLQDDYSLRIDRLTYPRDQGTFVCNGLVVSAVTVKILSNPEAIEIQGSWTKQGVRYLNVTHGKSVTVDCETSGAGKLPSSYAWRLGNQDITRTSFQKSLTYIFNKSDNGKSLRCITESAAEGSVRLNVHYAPSTPAILSDKGLQLEVIEDEDISLKCDSNGNPVPRITWLRGAQIIGHGNKYTISNAKRLDAGTYTCRARNGVDTAENQKQLVVKYPPAVTLAYRRDLKQLTCEASNGHPQLYSFEPWTHAVNGKKFPTEGISRSLGNTLFLDVSNVTYRSSGDYFCSVTNGVKGYQTSTMQIQAESVPAFAKQPTVFKAKRSKPLDVQIRFWSNPSPTYIKWRERGQEGEQNHWISGTITKTDVLVDMEFTDSVAPLKGYEAVLSLQPLEEADASLYTVWVENTEGFATYNIEIFIEEDGLVLTLTVMLCTASLIITVITLKVLIGCGVISCPDCKFCKRSPTSTTGSTAKHSDLFDSGRIRHRDPGPSHPRQSLQITLPKDLDIKVNENSPDQRYMPMGSPPATPVLPDPVQRVCDIEAYVRADTVQASAPPITELPEAAYEDVVYANEAGLMK